MEISMLKTSLEFKDKFPIDQVEEGNNIIQPGGLTSSRAICEIFRDFCQNVSAIRLDEEHNSWEFYADYNGGNFYFLLTDLGDLKLLQTIEKRSIFKKILHIKSNHEELISLIEKSFSKDDRFQIIQWVSM
jgi:hypothetical protein